MSDDVLIVGGGVIGLSTALELAEHGCQVRVLERGQFGREASWAGAGMIPPGEIHMADSAYRQLATTSSQMWPAVSDRLLARTGIDNEYHRCGALIFEATPGDREQEIAQWQAQAITANAVSTQQLRELQPSLTEQLPAGYTLPDQAQVRNPRHLQALLAACQQAGVQLKSHTEVQGVEANSDRLVAVETSAGRFAAGQFLLAGGAWSGELASRLDLSLPLQPIRGQIALLKTAGQLTHIIEQGKRYLVPRWDGHLLIGSTEESVDFQRDPDAAALAQLQQFAAEYVPEFASLPLVTGWCGFRPVTTDRLPVLGKTERWENLVIASGHYRAGLSLSPVTAVLMRQILGGEQPQMPIQAFSPDRFTSAQTRSD